MTSTQKIIKYCAIAFALFLAVSIIGGIVSAVASLSFISGGKQVVEDMKTYAISDTVDDLEIDLAAAQLEIISGDKFSVETNHKYLKLENKSGQLTIKETRQIVGFHSPEARVILTIPEDYTFREAEISTAAGTVKMDALSADKLSLDLGAGEVTIDKLTAGSRARINGGAGQLTINGGSLANLDFDMGVGKVVLTSALTGEGKIDYGVGELCLTLIGSAKDYRIELDKGIGEALLDGQKIADDTVYGQGENTLEIDGGVGSMDIRFTER